MSDDRMKYPERSNELNTLMGWLREFFGQFQLAWDLLWDGRVPIVTKIIPLLTVFYFFLPIDLLPDLALGLGQLDDLAIFLVGLRLFIDVCPPELVKEHQGGRHAVHTDPEWTPPEGPVIDIEAKAVEDEEEEAV